MRRFHHTLAIALSITPALAFAHSGSDAGSHHALNSALAAFAHPFTGIDHLLAMIAVGLWSALAFAKLPRRMAAAPLSFALTMAAGAGLAMAGVTMPAVEPMIAVSLLVMGFLIAARAQISAAAISLIVAAFALFHGAAHGQELTAGSAASALLGMLLGTAVLHATGIAMGLKLHHASAWFSRIAGAGVALFGAGLIAGLV